MGIHDAIPETHGVPDVVTTDGNSPTISFDSDATIRMRLRVKDAALPGREVPYSELPGPRLKKMISNVMLLVIGAAFLISAGASTSLKPVNLYLTFVLVMLGVACFIADFVLSKKANGIQNDEDETGRQP